MAKRILMVGTSAVQNWQLHVRYGSSGFEAHIAKNIPEALEYLKNAPDQNTQLMVEEDTLAKGSSENCPDEIKACDPQDRGLRFIQYARNHQLIASDSHAYLVNFQKREGELDGVKSITYNYDAFAALDKLTDPKSYRKDERKIEKK